MQTSRTSAEASVTKDAENYKKVSPELLTLDTVRGMLKSLPPCSLKPQGAGPLRVTVYTFITFEGGK